MTKDTFTEALSITLRVTMIAGCTPATTPVTVAPASDLSDAALPSAVAAKPDPPPKPAVASCGHDVECCAAYVKNSADGGALPQSQETTNCCDVVLTRAEKISDYSSDTWRCCNQPGLRTAHQRFCSPWGPPMPVAIVWLDDTMTCQSYEWRTGPCRDTIQA